ncbi:MAG: flavodoxin [Frisingicoccus sp.]
MKKITALLLSALLVLSLAACGNSNQNTAEDTPAETENMAPTTEPAGSSVESTVESAEGEIESGETADAAEAGNRNILIAYFSVMETDGVDTVAGASRVAVNGEVLGNNEYIAQIIQRETGGDLFAIETVQEYPTTHDPLLEFAYNEKADNARPELATQIENLDSYDVIFLGFPNWNADLPMPLYTFLEEYDFSGKTIIPFTTHGGSGFSRTIQTISELQPNATVISDGLSISRNSVSGAENDVVDWVNGLDLTGE